MNYFNGRGRNHRSFQRWNDKIATLGQGGPSCFMFTSFPRSGVGMQLVTLQRHATLERCWMNSHAGAWERCKRSRPSFLSSSVGTINKPRPAPGYKLKRVAKQYFPCAAVACFRGGFTALQNTQYRQFVKSVVVGVGCSAEGAGLVFAV